MVNEGIFGSILLEVGQIYGSIFKNKIFFYFLEIYFAHAVIVIQMFEWS